METFLLIAVIMLSCIIAVLAIKVCLMRRAAREIVAQLAEKLAEETNTLIDLSCRDREMAKLASGINTQLKLLRNERQKYLHGDAELKNAVTNISHDLRTPLTAICGYLSLLEQQDKNEAVARYIEQISNRTEALRELTEELFRYSVVSSVQELSPHSVTLNCALEESLVSFYGAMQQKEITPIIEIPERKIERKLDPVAVNRIFSNIISNAVKYSDGDFSVKMDSNGVTVFSNTARSLDTVTTGKLFDRFYTVETGRNSTGLGLSIAKQLTQRMGGAIDADYICGKLLITVSFPDKI